MGLEIFEQSCDIRSRRHMYMCKNGHVRWNIHNDTPVCEYCGEILEYKGYITSDGYSDFVVQYKCKGSVQVVHDIQKHTKITIEMPDVMAKIPASEMCPGVVYYNCDSDEFFDEQGNRLL